MTASTTISPGIAWKWIALRKASHERAACLTLDTRVRERRLDDTGKRPVDLRRKDSAKPKPLVLVPVTCVE